MKIFFHVLYTWLLANVILPITTLLIDMLSLSGDMDFDNLLTELVMFTFFVLILSLPSLFLSVFFIKPIVSSRYSDFEKLFLWYVTAFSITVLNILLPLVLITGGLHFLFEDFTFFMIPALVSVFLSITFRYKYFLKLNKIYKHESNLV